MEGRFVVSLFLLVIVGHAVWGQVGSLCRPKERLLMCGCPKTCREPAPDCAAVCKPGCYCEEGEVRNGEGLCVKLADCPPIKSAYTADTTEPRENHGKCPPNEEYRFCEPCNRTCDNPDPVCPAQCARGCFCKDGLLRDKDQQCVKPEACIKTAEVSPTFFIIASDSQQVLAPSIEDCAPDEEFFSCGWCEPSCSDPSPECPKVCTRGCLCKPPLLRHHSGRCVEEKDCLMLKCKDQNEEFVCKYGCEHTCLPQPCYNWRRRCTLGCYCKIGLYRDSANDRCVPPDMCTDPKMSKH